MPFVEGTDAHQLRRIKAHRTLVATLVGQLAVAPNPDQSVTARRLDATLSPNEQQAILRANANALAARQAFAQQMVSQPVVAGAVGVRNALAQDAGSVLLRTLTMPSMIP